ncbi:MAG: hypothetical protein NTV92_08800, partial [Candidatus Bipolaricaulota bacterium]|nr:hypothetical protein [Candidatus Bipolaricaulota bacterium]
MRRFAVFSISLGLGLLALFAPALSAAPELIYHRFDPLVVSASYAGNVLYEIKVTGSPTRVVLVLNALDG